MNEMKLKIRDWPKLAVKNSLLKRNVGTISQIVLPKKYHRLAIKALHEDMGHLGTERVFDLARQRFFSRRMHTNIEHFIAAFYPKCMQLCETETSSISG